jgi:4-amino-4-deoxy-L-arabinose transferase-like glycosyltransferase
MVAQALCAAAVIWLMHWTVASSGGFNPPGEEDYYNYLVRGWRDGHLYLAKEPRPEMLQLADPYDPAQNHAVRLGDASYYQGHYYLYFSAAPALLLHLPYGLITGRELGTTTAVFLYLALGYLATCVVWSSLRARFFPSSSTLLGVLGILLLGLGNPLLVLARRPLVWELPITAAYAFASLTLLAVYLALTRRHPRRWLVVAGVTAGAMVACRPGDAFAVALFLPVLWHLGRDRPISRATLVRFACVAVPIGLWLVALLAHNHARFGRPLEFGINYQLTSTYEAKQRHFALEYAPHNAWIYFLQPLRHTPEFPHVAAVAVRGGPRGYLGEWVEPIAGLLPTFPFLFAILGCLAWPITGPAADSRLRVLTIAVAVAAAGTILFYLCFYCATPRYTAAFAPLLALLASLGALLLAERWAGSRLRTAWLAVFAVLALASITHGVLLGFDYHDRLLQRLRPDYWNELARAAAAWRP